MDGVFCKVPGSGILIQVHAVMGRIIGAGYIQIAILIDVECRYAVGIRVIAGD